MRARLRSSRSLQGLLGLSLLLALALGLLARPHAAAASQPGHPAQEGAQQAFERARLEQALIRAETTAALLRVLEEAPVLGGGGS